MLHGAARAFARVIVSLVLLVTVMAAQASAQFPPTPPPGPSTTTVTSSSGGSSNAGDLVTFTATVTSFDIALTPTGTVTFSAGSLTIGTGNLVNGVASVTTGTLPFGTLTITATYSGDTRHLTSDGTVIEAIAIPPATVTVTADQNQAAPGTTITFTATLTGVGPQPTGTVDFMNGQQLLGTANVVAGVATFSTASLPAGPTTITAAYSGDQTYAVSSGTILQTVTQLQTAPTILLVSDVNPAAFGATVTFTATVTGSGATPTGTVTFLDGQRQPLATVTLVAGVATFSTSALPAGPNSIDASYSGDLNYTGGSSRLAQAIGAPAPPVPPPAPPATTATIRFKTDVPLSPYTQAMWFDLPGLGLSTSGGDQTVAPGKVQIIATMVEKSIYATGVTCTGGRPSYSIAADGKTATVDLDLAAGDDVTCTFAAALTPTPAVVAPITISIVKTVSSMSLLASTQTSSLISSISVSRLTGGFTSATGMGQLMSMFPMAENGGQFALQGSLGALDRQMAPDAEQRRFDVWFQARWQGVKAGSTEGSVTAGVVGADYLVTPRTLVGAFGAIDQSRFGFRSTNGRLNGTGWLAGAYVATKLSDRLFFDAAIGGGAGRNSISPVGTFTDAYSTSRLLASASLTGSWKHGGWTFVPTARLSYVRETSTAYVDSVGNTIRSDTASLFQASAGPGFTYTHLTESGLVMEPGLAFDVLARIQTSTGTAAATTFYGRIEPSLAMRTEAGMRFDLRGNVELGRNYTSWGGTAKVTYAFD